MSSETAASADANVVVEFSVALDVVRTLRPLRTGPTDPTSAQRGQTFWKARHTSEGPATVACRQTAPDAVTFWAWGPGSDEALVQARGWLGLDDNLEEFDPSGHPTVARLARTRTGVRMGRFGDAFDRIVPTILGQLVIGQEAERSHARLVHRYGTPAPGPMALKLPPDGATYAALGSHDFHRAGVERKRAEIIQRVARQADRIDRLVDVSFAEAYRYLDHIRGIGPWTSSFVGRTAFGDPDSVIVGDYNLPHTVAWALLGKRRSDDEEMLTLLEPFAGHRGRVQGMLKGNGKPPRHGPKNPFREIERH